MNKCMNKCFLYYDAHSSGNFNLDSSYTHQVENVDSSCIGQETGTVAAPPALYYGLFQGEGEVLSHQGQELQPHNDSNIEKLLPLQQLGSDENVLVGVAGSGSSTAFNFISPFAENQIVASLCVLDAGHKVQTVACNEGTGGSQSFSFIGQAVEEEVNGIAMCMQQTTHLPSHKCTLIKGSANTNESTNGQFETCGDVSTVTKQFGTLDNLINYELGTNVPTHPNNIVVNPDLASLPDIELSLFDIQSGKGQEDEDGDRDTDKEGIQLTTINTTDLISDNGQVGCPSTVDGVLPLLSTPTATPGADRCHIGDKLKSPRGKKRKNRREPRMWEIKNPFQDKEREKKRIDAIRAKRNRDRNKKEIEDLERKLAHAIKIRNALKTEVSQLEEKEKSLTACQAPSISSNPKCSQ